MEINTRIYTTLSISDLKNLKGLALKEHEDFFIRNLHLKERYYNNLIGICLYQGAASHYIDPSIGIKDFDIWHFYLKEGNFKFPERGSHKHIKCGYIGIDIDYLKRGILKYLVERNRGNPKKIIIEYMLEKNTKTKRLLLKKAIIGLYPSKIFNKILWIGE